MRLCFGRRVEWLYVNVGFIIRLFTEYYGTIYQSEERMIFTNAYVITGAVLGTTLANDDIACDYFLASEYFNAEALAMGFASVLGTTDAFLVSHDLKR